MPLANGGTSVKFNGNELQSANVIISRIEPFGGLQKELNYFKIARSNRSRRTNQVYPQRIIPMSGKIIGSSIANLKTQIDAFHTLMEVPAGTSANLDVDVAQTGTYRRWTADPQQIDIIVNDSLFSVDFSMNFICPDPFGRDTSSSSLLAATLTASGGTTALSSVGGTAHDQLPVVTLTLTSFTTAATSNTISITNPASGQVISITRAWVAGDVIVIDFSQQLLTVNGVSVDYQGPLTNMSWLPGAGNIIMTDDFSVRSIPITVTNVNRYK